MSLKALYVVGCYNLKSASHFLAANVAANIECSSRVVEVASRYNISRSCIFVQKFCKESDNPLPSYG